MQAQAAAAAERVVFGNPQFVCSVGDNPAPQNLRYVVFAGKSNAGKSSVINTLCGGRFARVAKTPGRTRLINIFRLSGSSSAEITAQNAIADLPGYGYAAVSHSEQAMWGRRLTRFINKADIRCLVLVTDIRRGIGALDDSLLNLYTARNRNRPAIILLNKADKLNKREQAAALTAAQQHTGGTMQILLFSALKKTGTAEVRDHISTHLQTAQK